MDNLRVGITTLLFYEIIDCDIIVLKGIDWLTSKIPVCQSHNVVQNILFQ